MHTPFKLNKEQMQTVETVLSKLTENKTIDFKDGSIFFVDASKTIETGRIHKHVRLTNNFIVIESVLYGFAKNFLDSVTILTIDGCLVNKVFRVRSTEYENGASHAIVEKFLKEYLHTKENVESYLQPALTELYDAAFQNRLYTKVKK